MPSTTASTELPSRDRLDLATHMLGSFTSELDCFKTMLKRFNEGRISSVEEYLALTAEERAQLEARPGSDEARLLRDDLAHLCVFATSALEDTEQIIEDARAIQHLAMASYYEAASADDGREHWQRVRAWHAEKASGATS